MSTDPPTGTGYIREMQVARGIGILLVTFGHSEPVREVFPVAWDIVYSFHMPLFFFMSGFFSLRLIRRSWLTHILPQTLRYAFPYVVISLAFAAIKLLAPEVKRQVIPGDLPQDILLYPFNNPALFLWFLYVFLLMRLISPLFRGKMAVGLLPVVIVAACWPGSIEIFGLWSFCKHLVYYLTGIILARHLHLLLTLLKDLRLGVAVAVIFIGVTLSAPERQVGPLSVLTAFSGIWGVLVLSSLKIPGRLSDMLEYCGRFSLEIYLLQYFFIFPIHFVLQRATVDGHMIVFCTFLIGLAGPILLERFILRRNRWLALLLSGRTSVNHIALGRRSAQ